MGLRTRLNAWNERSRQHNFQSKQRAQIEHYLQSHPVRKLQIGCGFNLLEGWLNTDLLNYSDDVVFLDVTKTFPFPDQSFDLSFSEHVIQHLSYPEGVKMLSEVFRILKPRGKFRIAAPNVQFLMELYSGSRTPEQEKYISWFVERFLPGVEAHKEVFVINHFFRAWGHQFLYDPPTMESALTQQGFHNVNQCNPGESTDISLQALEKHGQIIGDEFNRLETFVLEAEKP